MALSNNKMLTSTMDYLLHSSSPSHFRPLTCAASSIPLHPARLASNPPDLIRWVRREGGAVHKGLKIADVDSLGLGLVTSQEIPKGSELIALPKHIPLTFRDSPGADGPDGTLTELACRVPGGNPGLASTAHLSAKFGVLLFYQSIAATLPESSVTPSEQIYSAALQRRKGGDSATELRALKELWAMRLGLKLLRERATVGSFWWPYIGNLPEAFSVPIFFSGDEIKNLQYAPLLHQVNKRCRFLLDFEKEVKRIVENLTPDDHPFGGQHLDASSLGWAMSAVSSRAFRLHGEILPDGTQSDVHVLLPLIDMCNHSFQPNAHIVQERDARDTKMSVKVVAEIQIEQDTPLTLNYGCLSNDLLLLDYGFVIPSNPYDYVELKYDGVLLDAASMAAGVSSPTFSTPAQWQQEILSQLNLHGEGAVLKVSLGGPELIDGRLLAALRVILATDVETGQMHDLSSLKTLASQAPLGASNEIAALRTVIALCVIALGHFPTKIMEDESLLRQNISCSTRLAVQFRIEKKSMIIDVMKDLTRRVNMLSKVKTAV